MRGGDDAEQPGMAVTGRHKLVKKKPCKAGKIDFSQKA
jgi:hypothetical protein